MNVSQPNKALNDFLADHNRILDAPVQERTRQLVSGYRETIATITRDHHRRRRPYPALALRPGGFVARGFQVRRNGLGLFRLAGEV